MVNAHLVNHNGVSYIGKTRGFEDVNLISIEGKIIQINSCVLASLSPLSMQIMKQVHCDPFSGGEFYISTDHLEQGYKPRRAIKYTDLDITISTQVSKCFK